MFYAGFVPREKGTQLTRSVGRRLRKSKTREVNRQQSEISIKSNRKVNTVFGVVKQLACKQQFPTPSKHLCPEPWNMILYISVMLIICSQLLWTRFFFFGTWVVWHCARSTTVIQNRLWIRWQFTFASSKYAPQFYVILFYWPSSIIVAPTPR